MTAWCASVRSLLCTSMVRLKSCVRDCMELRSSTTMPPPSTVSIVLASRLGVNASKSCAHVAAVLAA